ncbi:uncharacterized protein LOC111000306 [Pieris rapae]|uniref:uncharacterized protein LOC111000306 n=1 Tax=Pieris rapae TaxID=64459 RepID=UPI001E27F30E|nr:uncharacterized protein LOC111000306 [Pieris rapae]
MGGCKCTYRNCTIKTDGKTHMFHYPVFNKIRCHQWIINARRYEFLNLKVSQLKNRVVCQHHFKDDNFMNCQKAKLTMDAIPTEDGPYCDPSKWKKDQNIGSVLPLLTDEIENDVLTHDEKVANYSIKYADFLTNFESDLLNSTNIDSFSLDCKNPVGADRNMRKCSDRLVFQPNTNINSPLAIVNPYDKSSKKPSKEITVEEIIIEDNVFPNEEKQIIQGDFPLAEVSMSLLSNKQQEEPRKIKPTTECCYLKNKSMTTPSTPVNKTSKVKILSEKKIKDAISIPKNLQPISPSSVIKLPNKAKQINVPISTGTQISVLPVKGNFLVTREQNLVCPVDSNIEKQEPPQYSLDIQYQTLENEQPSYSLNLNSLKFEHPSVYTLEVNEPQENLLGTNSIVINEPFIPQSLSSNELQTNTTQPLYTIDINGKKQKCLPNKTGDTNRLEIQTIGKPVDVIPNKTDTTMLCLNNLLPQENQSVIKVLDNKYTVNVEFATQSERNTNIPSKTILKPKELSIINDTKKSVSPSKGRVSPKRLAVIEKKRKFNKKLIDAVIALDNNIHPKPPPKIVKVLKYKDQGKNELQKVQESTQVSSYLSTESKLPSVHEYTLKFLEDRLQQMENRLLGKIDQNSQKIQEMKESIKSKAENKTMPIQASANGNPETYKRQLYNEISQFLSPSCSSAVYEELFINKYSIKKSVDNDEVSSKRRRCR